MKCTMSQVLNTVGTYLRFWSITRSTSLHYWVKCKSFTGWYQLGKHPNRIWFTRIHLGGGRHYMSKVPVTPVTAEYAWVCYRWNWLLLIEFTRKVTSSLWVQKTRICIHDLNLMTALLRNNSMIPATHQMQSPPSGV